MLLSRSSFSRYLSCAEISPRIEIHLSDFLLFPEENTGSSGHENTPCKLPFQIFQKTCPAIKIPSNSLHSTVQGSALRVRGKVKMHALK